MLLQMSAEINDLKALSFRQGESSREQARLLSSGSTDIGDQIYQARQNTVKLNEASLSIIDTLEQTKNSSGAINSVNEATKGISSQLLRVENSALEIARELASKLGSETVVKEKKALQKSKIMFSSALFLLSVIEKDDVLGLWTNYYKLKEVEVLNADPEFKGEVTFKRVLIEPEMRNEISKTTSTDIESIAIFIYWILMEASIWQASLGKKVMGLKVVILVLLPYERAL